MAENNNYPYTVDSRSVEIIETIINQEEYDIPHQSRLEEVLLELKEAILQGVSPIDYSTTEQNTGRKWIDGKPIYQISTLASGSDLFDVNTLSIDKLLKVEALGSDASGYTSNKWTIEGISGSSNRMIYLDAFSEKITYTGSFPLYAATIWYTKTTDTAE